MRAVLAREYRLGEVLVIRYEGPRGGPGMREIARGHRGPFRAGAGESVALVRTVVSSGGTRGFCVGHVAPEAAVGGPIALIEDGDLIFYRPRYAPSRCGPVSGRPSPARGAMVAACGHRGLRCDLEVCPVRFIRAVRCDDWS